MDATQVGIWVALTLAGALFFWMVVRVGFRMGLGVASTMIFGGGLVLLFVGGLVALAYVIVGPWLGLTLEPGIAVYWAAWMAVSGLTCAVGLGVKVLI